MKPALAFTVATLVSALFSPARALCIYDGIDNAKTTLDREFVDSRWVVRARVLAAKDHWSDTEDSWTIYRIRVERSYKGEPPRELRFFTYRDSGGFYMDRAWKALPEGHDVGGEYLLFLNPSPRRRGNPAAMTGTVFVNYSCGVSKAWREVSAAERNALTRLEAPRNPSSGLLRRPPSPARGEGFRRE
jgi:hypothetical protein